MTIRSISNLPDWLVAGIADYQQKHNLQSWSQAAVILMTLGLHNQTVHDPEREGWIGGSKEAEEQLFAKFEESGADNFEDWLIGELGGSWGGQRK